MSNNTNNNVGVKIEISMEELRKRSIFLATPCYGGQCNGLFAKSVADLAALCNGYGIKLYIYFLFNESLITRARNYCCDEFYRSDATHMMFIDSDIGFNPQDVIALLALSGDDSPYDIIGGAYPKKSLPYNALVTTEDGQKQIGSLVKNKYSGKVLTINEKTGKLEWNKVVQHHHNPNNHKWIKLFLSKNKLRGKNITLTYDHEISLIADPLRPQIEFCRADEMLGKNTMVQAGKFKALFNSQVTSALVGTLLGDGCISKKDNRLSCGHGEKQKAYAEFKQQMFGGRITKHKNVGYGKHTDALVYQLSGPVNGQTKYIRELMYDKNDKKTVKNILSYVDDIALSFWYMDDGCLKKSGTTGHYIELNTQGFSDEDQRAICSFFNDKYKVSPVIDVMYPVARAKNPKGFKRIRFNNADSGKLLKVMAPYIHESMNYKLPKELKTAKKHTYDTSLLDYAITKVDSIERVDLDSDQYDIGVENNHNFITSSVHVRNCISWEKIKQAVDKGFADENPNNLEKFVGDYVFNPKAGAVSIPINQPVEVMEIGTGFMMIRKKTLTTFNEKMPHLLYRPDHVRTSHFDGSREIMSYFDCIIDRGYDIGDLKRDYAMYKDGQINEVEYMQRMDRYFENEKKASKRYLSEDYKFSQDAIRLGMKVWLCPWMKLQHTGSYVFGGSLVDIAALGASATADVNLLNKAKQHAKKEG